jgi:2',3'-cyclic-nucleotide 2'-phosphodiesterase (5'-nucleotidase family)
MEEKNGRGGMARFAAAVKAERERARATNRHLICVHAGDTLSPSPMSSLDEGQHMIELFNEAGLDYFVPGNHGFDFGKEVYFKRMAEARFQILAANLRDAAGLQLPGHNDRKMFEVDGVIVALIGATYEQTPAVSSPGDLLFTKTKRAVVDSAKRARDAGADFVAAIVHANKLAGAVLMNEHKVDLILSGHNHDLHIDFDGRAALVESEQDANFVTVIDIDFAKSRDEATGLLPWWPNFRVIDTARIDPDPSAIAKVRDYGARLQKELEVEIATLTSPLESHTACVRLGECAIGNLIADALRKAVSADVAIVNGGTVRRGKVYPAGTKLTKRDIHDELPFNNKTVLMKVSGKDIWAALENGFSELPDPSGRFPQVSGLSVVADREARPGKRVNSVTVNGEQLDLAASISSQPMILWLLATMAMRCSHAKWW